MFPTSCDPGVALARSRIDIGCRIYQHQQLVERPAMVIETSTMGRTASSRWLNPTARKDARTMERGDG
jgi:hypothetical protein